MAMEDKDYYEILGVSKDASQAEIRKAFQKKAATLHPDVNKAPDAQEKFKDVSEAYAVLSDEDKRRRYDAMRSGVPFAGAGGSQTPGGYGADPFGGAGDPFGFGGFPFGGGFRTTGSRRPSRSYNPKAGADVRYNLDLDDATATKGTKRGVTYQRYAPCEACHGQGSIHAEHAETCPTCGGTGHISVDLTGLFGFGVFETECPECQGSGKVVVDPCYECGGTGRVLTASEVVVDVPAGSHDGDVIRIKGMGNAGTNGMQAGDFVCRVGVPSERVTRRQSYGMQIIGFMVPFLVEGLISMALGYAGNLFFPIVFIVVGVILVAGDGIKKRARWWRNAGSALLSGFLLGLIFALLIGAMNSCALNVASSSAGSMPSGGMGSGAVSG